MIFLTGPTGAGKTYFATFLAKKGFAFIDTGPTLRKLWIDLDTKADFKDFLGKAEDLFGKEFTNWYLALEISKELEKLSSQNSNKDLLVVGNRSPEGINYLKKNLLKTKGERSVVVYIEAQEELLLERFCEREGTDILLDEFRYQELLPDTALGLERIRDIADYRLTNNGSVVDFEAKILKLIHEDLGFEGGPSFKERK